MKLYRISPEKYLNDLRGLGASYQDGARWNRPGQPVIYFALSPATALLEMANYLPSPRLVPESYRLGIYEAPEAISLFELPEEQLPGDWAEYPYPISTQTLGGDWLDKGSELVLLVPSAAVPGGLERSAVVNPQHPECCKIKLIDSNPDLYNKRTFSGL
ncbi:MAG: RES family NAD+ phosphorylase [Candidatus Polarisedimenticolaceae bacterium]|nr:RES family NAD+ phosphorylase [Candidatus Polarisedimenticolaceae bacterium]